MIKNYGFNDQNSNIFRFNRNINGNNNNFQDNQNNNFNINNNLDFNNQFRNSNNNFGNVFINNFTNNNMNQSQGFIQMNNNFNMNYKEMLSKFLVIIINKNSINNNIYSEIQNLKNCQYVFFEKGLNNIGSTCFMNATLQCLIHVNELVLYFINIYPKDSNGLNKINKNVDSRGQISKAFFNVIKGISSNANNNSRVSMFNYPTNYNSFSPDEFKRAIGKYNRQFERFEANDSKDLILYLFQTIHEELNYLGNNSSLPIINRPNQLDENQTFNYFFSTYNMRNFSIISEMFYGTYKNITTCLKCRTTIYNFQKFEFLSFGMYDYHGEIFTLYNGLDDNERQQELKGENQFYCNKCKKLCDAKVTTKIIEAPDKLLINIDYGKNKKFQPSAVVIDDPLDLTKYVIGQQQKLLYNLIGVCKHLGRSGSTGHYIAYCKNKEKNIWYKFNDSSCGICDKYELKKDSPYLLLYEMIM
jgi:ubiquitin carboxyl-terminal hydrolase 8